MVSWDVSNTRRRCLLRQPLLLQCGARPKVLERYGSSRSRALSAEVWVHSLRIYYDSDSPHNRTGDASASCYRDQSAREWRFRAVRDVALSFWRAVVSWPKSINTPYQIGRKSPCQWETAILSLEGGSGRNDTSPGPGDSDGWRLATLEPQWHYSKEKWLIPCLYHYH